MSLEETVETSKTTEDAHVEGQMKDDVKLGDSSSKKRRDDVDPSKPKIYFERQTDCYCSLATLNNLYGYHAFTQSTLKRIGSLLQSLTSEDIELSYEFQEVERDFNIDVLMVSTKACKSKHDGWLCFRIVSTRERNAEFMINQKKLLVHEKHVENLSKRHYYCYTQEHGNISSRILRKESQS